MAETTEKDRVGVSTRMPVSYPVLYQTDWYVAEGVVLNLSTTGCAIETERCLIYGEYVRLHIVLPGEVLGVEVGKIRWSEPHRFGIEFLKLPAADQQRLADLIAGFYSPRR